MPTANDKAWEHYITVNHLALDGRSHVIRADKLKRDAEREPRLLAKVDEPDQLPRILKDNAYSIIATSNGSYLIFRGNIFAPINRCAVSDRFDSKIEFPLATVGRGTGESEYLDNAFNSGLISHFTQGDKLYLTIRGRERTRPFDFRIEASNLPVEVDGVQIEVDAGYEGDQDIVLVEAKIGTHNHFNIRQLYYPFRHFSLLVPHKRVRTLFFEYDLSRATYTLYEFIFADPMVFDSIQQQRCCVYALTPPVSYRIDDLIDARFATTADVVPQANDLNKVLELLALINSGENTVTEISDHFVFDPRQSNYYGEAAEYLDLITRQRGHFELTERGREFLSTTFDRQQIYIAKLVANSWVFREVIRRARRKRYFTLEDVDAVIMTARHPAQAQRYTHSTIPRRRQTIIAWARWLAEQIHCFQIDGDKYRLA